MNPPRGQNIYLTGFSGTGKSSSGRAAARQLNWAFVDTDTLIERREGRTIPEIFETLGEAHFRRVEAAVLEDVAGGSRQVISTGGGLPTSPANRAMMRRSGVCVRLAASPESIHDRLSRRYRRANDASVRPLLGADAPIERIRSLLAERETAYAEADATITTDGMESGEAGAHIITAWRRLTRESEESK